MGTLQHPPLQHPSMQSIGNPWLWTAFAAIVLAMLAVDLSVGGGRRHRVSFREAAVWSVVSSAAR